MAALRLANFCDHLIGSGKRFTPLNLSIRDRGMRGLALCRILRGLALCGIPMTGWAAFVNELWARK
jgi:hypothetical protein